MITSIIARNQLLDIIDKSLTGMAQYGSIRNKSVEVITARIMADIDKSDFFTNVKDGLDDRYSSNKPEIVEVMIGDKKLLVPFVNISNNPLPEYKTKGSSGMDLHADIDNDRFVNINTQLELKEDIDFMYKGDKVSVLPGKRCAIPTGLFTSLPEGYEAQMRPRSGLAIKKGITLINTPGTIDNDYRGEIIMLVINHSNSAYHIKHSDRIAQLIIAKFEQCTPILVDALPETERGEGGMGHTGN